MPAFNFVVNFLVKGATAIPNAIRQANAGLGLLASRLSQTEDLTRPAFAQIAGGFTSLFIARQAAGAVASAIGPAVQLEDSLVRLQSRLGATSEEMTGIQRAAFAAAEATKFSPVQAIEGFEELTRAGVRSRDAMVAITPALALAQLAGIDAGEGARIGAALFRNFGLRGDELKLGFDKLVVSERQLGVRLEEMPDIIERMGLAAVRGGQSLDSLLLTFGLARPVIGNAKRTIDEIVRATGELSRASTQQLLLQKLGVNTIDATTGRMKQMPQLFLELGKAMEDQGLRGERALDAALGEAAIKPVLVNIQRIFQGFQLANGQFVKGEEALAALQKAFAEAGGTLEVLNKERMASALMQFGRFTEALTNLLVAVVLPFIPVLTFFAEHIANVASAFAQMVQSSTTLKVLAFFLTGAAATAIFLGAVVLGGIGVFRIYGAAINFATLSIARLIGKQGEEILAAGGMSAVVAVAADASMTLGIGARIGAFGVRSLTLAMRGLLALTGIGAVVGILVMVADVLGLFKGVGGIPGLDKAEDSRQGILAATNELAKNAEDIAKTMAGGAEDLEEAMKAFRSEVQKIAGAKAPFLKRSEIDELTNAVLRNKGALSKQAGGFAAFQGALDALALVRTRITKGETATTEERMAALKVTKQLQDQFFQLQGETSRTADQAGKFADKLVQSLSPEAEMVALLREEFEAKNDILGLSRRKPAPFVGAPPPGATPEMLEFLGFAPPTAPKLGVTPEEAARRKALVHEQVSAIPSGLATAFVAAPVSPLPPELLAAMEKSVERGAAAGVAKQASFISVFIGEDQLDPTIIKSLQRLKAREMTGP